MIKTEKVVNFLSVASAFLMVVSIAVLLFGSSIKDYSTKAASVLSQAASAFLPFSKSNSKQSLASAQNNPEQDFYIYSFEFATSTPELEDENATSTIDTTDWKIYYRKLFNSDFDAYTFRYPKDFDAFEDEYGGTTLTYQYKGHLYTIFMSADDILFTPEKHDDQTATTTKIGLFEYEQTNYITNSTTTQVLFIPKSDGNFFSKIVASLPEQESDKYMQVLKEILKSLSFQKAQKPFSILSITANTPVKLKSKTSFANPLAYQISVKPFVDLESFVITFSLEDKDGRQLLPLPEIRDLRKKQFTFNMPPLCEAADSPKEECLTRSQVLGKKFYIVARGFACKASAYLPEDCPQHLRMYADEKYSNPITFIAPVEFSNQQISIQPADSLENTYEITAQLYAPATGFEYVLVLSDSSVVKLQKQGSDFYKVRFTKQITSPMQMALLRVAPDIVLSNFYNEKDFEKMLKLGDVLKLLEFKPNNNHE